MISKPRRVSMGRYAVYPQGREVILQRCGRSGFRVIMRPGAISPLYRRLRDAAAAAIANFNPWPFDVEKKPDLILDQPKYLRRIP